MKEHILAVDLGTSSCKVVLFDKEGTIVAVSAKEHPTQFGDGGAVDQNPEDWWDGLVYGIRDVIHKSKVEPQSIAAIGLDAQSTAMVPVDSQGAVLHPALIWMDKRSRSQVDDIERAVTQKTLTAINGNKNDVANLAPKILWFRDNFPDLYERTYQILNATGFYAYRLTGKFSCNISEGGLSQLFHMTKGEWSQDLLHGCGIAIDKMPPIYQCNEVVGGLTQDASTLLGLPSGIPVMAGSMDTVACGLGCGVVGHGDAFVTGGTVTALGVCTQDMVSSETFHTHPNIIPGTYLRVAGVDFGGGNYRWMRDTFFGGEQVPNIYETMNQLVETVPAGSEKLLFLPTTVGQRCPQWDPDMRGMFFGIAPIHQKAHFLRSVMEGDGFALRELIALQEAESTAVKKIHIASGIAKSNVWMEILRSTIHKELFVSYYEEATCLGNFISTAKGIGLLGSYQEGVDACQYQKVERNAQWEAVYDKLYPIYETLYPAVKQSFHQLAATKY